jgi:hypothetical protein
MQARSSLLLMAAIATAAMTGCGRIPESDAQRKAREAAEPAPPAARASYSAEWVSNDVPATMNADGPAEVRVSVRNTGDWQWSDPLTASPSKPDGRYAIRLTYRWVDESGLSLPQGSARGELQRTVPPGEVANFTIAVVPPSKPGIYQLQFDLVEELVIFFSARGGEKLSVPVTVQ